MRLILMGTGPFAVPTFRDLVDSPHDVAGCVTRPVRLLHERKAPPNPVRQWATSCGLPLWDPENVNEPSSIDVLRQQKADVLVVCDYGQILSSAALETTRLGGINLHGSLLPRYRGAAPVQWAVRNGEKETGVSVIHMTPKLDAGPILAHRRTEIDPNETAAQLEQRLAQMGPELVRQALDLLEHWDGQSAIGTPQDPALVSRAPRLRKQDGLVRWGESAKQIRNQVRAFQPWPGTFTHWQRPDGKLVRLILNEVDVMESVANSGPPGTVIEADKDDLIVACGEGALAIRRIQPAGKRSMTAAEFLRGYRLEPGDRLE